MGNSAINSQSSSGLTSQTHLTWFEISGTSDMTDHIFILKIWSSLDPWDTLLYVVL